MLILHQSKKLHQPLAVWLRVGGLGISPGPPKCEPDWHSGPAISSVVSSFASWTFSSMSHSDPNAAAPASATAQFAGVTSNGEIEKKRIELKSMLSTCFASRVLQICRKMQKKFDEHFLKY